MARPGKIGVLTFHRCINYGSYWQARCLVEGLRAMGHEAVLLDHISSRIDRREWRCALEPQLPTRSSPLERRLYSRKIRHFLQAVEELPRSRAFDLDQPCALETCDTVVVGSDEVWNLRHPWYGGHATFYGSGIRTERLVAYAASFGNQHALDELPSSCVDALSSFALISVRDDNSAGIVRRALGLDPEVVLDPCLQFPPTIEPSPYLAASTPYVAVYGHGFPTWFARTLRSWADATGVHLLSIGYGNDWADDHHIGAGPHAFAQLMAGAAAVATNFFHGCIFALLNAKPFACVSSDYRANKLLGLMRLLSAGKHLLSMESQTSVRDGLLDEPPDSVVLRRIEDLRLRSHCFIQQALGS